MTVRDALERHLLALGIRSPQTPAGKLYDDPWIRYPVGGRRIPVFPLGPVENAVAIHDIHHMLTGYGTDLQGEVEVAAWEMASGGCGRHWFMWFDRVSVVFIGAFFPKAFLAAWKKGWRAKNLYRMPLAQALGMELEASKRYTGGFPSPS